MRKRERTRVPLGGLRTKLNVKPIEGYVLRWMNDFSGRIQDAEQAGYEFVSYTEIGGIGQSSTSPESQEMGEKVSKQVGVTETGAPLIAYLMKIKQEWYDEDQAEKADRVNASESAIKNLQGVDGDTRQHSYGNISIS